MLSRENDSHDVKAVGLLGLDSGAIAGLALGRGGLPALWWMAMVALAACLPLFLFTLRARPFYSGPDLPIFYEEVEGAPALRAGAMLLADLEGYLDHNRRTLRPKARAFSLGLLLFIVGAVFAAGFLLYVSLTG